MNTQTQENSPFGTESIGKLILKFGVPGAIALVVNALYNIVDQIFIGQSVGYLGNAATNVCFPIVTIALSFAILVGDGSAAYYSLMLGAKDNKKAELGISNSYLLLAILSVILTALGLIFMNPLLKIFGATTDVMPYAVSYTRIVLLGFPAVIIGTGLNSTIRADGSPNYAMFIMLLGAVINTILDPILIFKFNMGMEGAAIATILGQYASLIMGLLYLPRFKYIKLKLSSFKFDKFISFKVCSLGVSSFISQISIVAVMFVINQLLVIYGAKSVYGSNIPLAVFGIVMKVNQILNSILLGIALGSQPVAGYNYGAKNYLRVKDTFKIAVFISTLCATVAFILFMFFPQQIISIFGNESALYNEFAVKSFRLHLPLCIVAGFYVTASILFQAIGKPKIATFLSLSRQILFYIPLSIGMAVLFGIDGLLIGGAVADFLAFVVSAYFVFREMKQLTSLHKAQL